MRRRERVVMVMVNARARCGRDQWVQMPVRAVYMEVAAQIAAGIIISMKCESGY